MKRVYDRQDLYDYLAKWPSIQVRYKLCVIEGGYKAHLLTGQKDLPQVLMLSFGFQKAYEGAPYWLALHKKLMKEWKPTHIATLAGEPTQPEG